MYFQMKLNFFEATTFTCTFTEPMMTVAAPVVCVVAPQWSMDGRGTGIYAHGPQAIAQKKIYKGNFRNMYPKRAPSVNPPIFSVVVTISPSHVRTITGQDPALCQAVALHRQNVTFRRDPCKAKFLFSELAPSADI